MVLILKGVEVTANCRHRSHKDSGVYFKVNINDRLVCPECHRDDNIQNIHSHTVFICSECGHEEHGDYAHHCSKCYNLKHFAETCPFCGERVQVKHYYLEAGGSLEYYRCPCGALLCEDDYSGDFTIDDGLSEWTFDDEWIKAELNRDSKENTEELPATSIPITVDDIHLDVKILCYIYQCNESKEYAWTTKIKEHFKDDASNMEISKQLDIMDDRGIIYGEYTKVGKLWTYCFFIYPEAELLAKDLYCKWFATSN